MLAPERKPREYRDASNSLVNGGISSLMRMRYAAKATDVKQRKMSSHPSYKPTNVILFRDVQASPWTAASASLDLDQSSDKALLLTILA